MFAVELTPPLAEEAAGEIEEVIASIESSTKEESLKKDCLKRDGFRCVYSGAYDMASTKASLVDVPTHLPVAKTECAHIIPFALGKFDDSRAIETRNKATIWFAIHRYFPALKGKIHAGNINQRENAFTLASSIHRSFGDYDLTFWPQSKVCLIIYFFFIIRKSLIHFWYTGRLVRSAFRWKPPFHYPAQVRRCNNTIRPRRP